jgi:hypothetical protein
VYYQHVGFATGVACGSEVANIYLHELLRSSFIAVSDHLHVYQRFIDDGKFIWSGTRSAAECFLTGLATDFADSHGFHITFSIDNDSTIFLDIRLFKGARWMRTGLLDSETYAKPINAYLYIPFNSCVPPSVLKGFIFTELQRHLLRCSSASSYYDNLALFYQRLRARGYPAAFLNENFARRLSFSSRQWLLGRHDRTSPHAPNAPSVLALPFSTGLEDATRGILQDADGVLPNHLAAQRRLIAWRKAPKIRDLLTIPGRTLDDSIFCSRAHNT